MTRELQNAIVRAFKEPLRGLALGGSRAGSTANQMDNNKRVIVFDLDGVIIDSTVLMYELTKGFFVEIDDQGVKDLHKENIHEALKKTKLEKKIETEDDRKKRHAIYAQKKLSVCLYEGIKELLVKLHKDNILTINTSSSNDNCFPVLERNDIAQYFDLVATKELHVSKIEKFKIIAEKFGKSNSELIFVTDTVGDIKEAKEAGVNTIVVTWGMHNREDFREAPMDYILGFADNPADLFNLINSK